MSRDDSGSFLPAYTEAEIVKKKSWRAATIRLAAAEAALEGDPPKAAKK